jgi:hypothetical protein
MKKTPLILEELLFWLRGRFSLTEEEKVWMLLVLILCWIGLAGRYFYLTKPASQPIEEVRRL